MRDRLSRKSSRLLVQLRGGGKSTSSPARKASSSSARVLSAQQSGLTKGLKQLTSLHAGLVSRKSEQVVDEAFGAAADALDRCRLDWLTGDFVDHLCQKLFLGSFAVFNLFYWSICISQNYKVKTAADAS